MAGFTHPSTESRFGNDILVGIVEGRVCFALEPQKLISRGKSWWIRKNSAKKHCKGQDTS